MSMYEEAEKINQRLKVWMIANDDAEPDNELNHVELMNIIIRFGQVAKFRCRSNAAYRNFVQSCYKDIVDVGTEIIIMKDGSSFEGLKAKTIHSNKTLGSYGGKEDGTKS